MEEKPQLHHIHVQRRPFIPLEGLFLSIKFKTANLYTHKKFRSLSNLHSQKSRSMKSVKIPWYQKPILHNNKYVNVQRGAMLAALFSFVSYINIFFFFKLRGIQLLLIFKFLSVFTIATSIFDLYCLSMAAPGSTHYGYYFISYEFVYVGNRHGNFFLCS